MSLQEGFALGALWHPWGSQELLGRPPIGGLFLKILEGHWGLFGAIWSLYGAIGAFWGLLGPSGGYLEPFGGYWGLLGAVGAFWGLLGSLEIQRVSCRGGSYQPCGSECFPSNPKIPRTLLHGPQKCPN